MAEQRSDLQLSVARGSMFCLMEGVIYALYFWYLFYCCTVTCLYSYMRRAMGGGGGGGRFLSLSSFSLPPPPPPPAFPFLLHICSLAMFAQLHLSSANVWPLLACASSLPVSVLFHYVYTYSWSLIIKYQDLLSLHYDHCFVYLPFAHFQSGGRCSRTDVL